MEANVIRGPRKYLRYPEQFGVVDPPQPARLPPSQQYKVKAALLQHEVARHVSEQMPRLEMSPADLAARVGVGIEQLRRLLRGESAMSAERMHQLAQAVGLTITITVEAE
ncbi:helix-turn-helix domain-containing protein [Nocardioides sp. GCM10027113]|uniref:helix-turn-helix domain-containing protein n=1 Tax=unclassified Nocardioides TaxID=2615069 RepID=UPI0036119B08